MAATEFIATAKVIDEAQGIAQVSNVRLGFKALWKPNIVRGVDTRRNTAQFWLSMDKEKEAFETLYNLAGKIYGKKVPFNDGKMLNDSGSTKWNGERFGIHHDLKRGVDCYCFKTTQPVSFKINYIDSKGRLVRDFNPDDVEDKIIYAGCRVNVRIRYSASEMDKKLVLWANLVAIQFAGHDSPLGGESEESITSSFGAVDTGVEDVSDSFGKVDIDSLM